MFEFGQYEKARHLRPTIQVPATLPELPILDKAAFLLWGEHCVECAAPDCYSTCDLYLSRPDGRCRRFEFGIYPNASVNSLHGTPAAEVVFQRWAKIEARGNARMIALNRLSLLDKVADWSDRLLRLTGKAVAQLSSDSRWRYLAFASSERFNAWLRSQPNRETPDAFLIDAYNPGEDTVEFSLSISASLAGLKHYLSPEQMPTALQRPIRIAPGHFQLLIAYPEFRHILESGLPFNFALTPLGDSGAHILFRALDLVTFAKQTAASPQTVSESVSATPAAKCVVFDLDNTLWHGVLLETDHVELHPAMAEVLRQLDQRGILLSIASKNGHQHAMDQLKRLQLDEYFLYPKINWGSKSESIKQIAKHLNIGLDTFVFVDDNPFELDEVSRALPMVECINATEINHLLQHRRLQGSTSQEARDRRQMYRATMVREEAESAFGEDYTAFLRDCDIRLNIRPDQAADFDRIAELVQRTNQLNFSGHKYQRDELLALFEDPALERYVLSCQDKFGSYGMIGFCMARRDGQYLTVQDLMLSCRVQGKFIESALLHFLCSNESQPVQHIAIQFRKTDRNTPAQHVLEKLGFDLTQAPPLSREVTADSFAVDFIQIET